MKFRIKQKCQIVLMITLLKLIVIISFLLFSELAQSAQCLTYRDTYWSSSQSLNVHRYEEQGLSVSGCLEAIVLTSAEYARLELLDEQNSESYEITAIDIGLSFTWGFGTYVGFWYMGYAIRSSRLIIRKT